MLADSNIEAYLKPIYEHLAGMQAHVEALQAQVDAITETLKRLEEPDASGE